MMTKKPAKRSPAKISVLMKTRGLHGAGSERNPLRKTNSSRNTLVRKNRNTPRKSLCRLSRSSCGSRLLVKQDFSGRIKLLQEVEIGPISGQHSASIFSGAGE